MLRCDSIGEPVSDRAIAAQAVTAGCRRAGGCAARRVLRLPADVSSDDCAVPRYWANIVRWRLHTSDLLHWPRWRQRQLSTNITGGSLNEAGQCCGEHRYWRSLS